MEMHIVACDKRGVASGGKRGKLCHAPLIITLIKPGDGQIDMAGKTARKCFQLVFECRIRHGRGQGDKNLIQKGEGVSIGLMCILVVSWDSPVYRCHRGVIYLSRVK